MLACSGQRTEWRGSEDVVRGRCRDQWLESAPMPVVTDHGAGAEVLR